MSFRTRLLAMTAAMGLLPALALAQGSAGSSMQPQATQTTPQQGPLSSTAGAAAGANAGQSSGQQVPGNNAGSPAGQGNTPNAAGGQRAQNLPTGNAAQTPPAAAPSPFQRQNFQPAPSGREPLRLAQATPPRDGTPGSPPSSATGVAIDRATGGSISGTGAGGAAPDATQGNPPGTAAGRALDRATGSNLSGANPPITATAATVPGVDPAALRGSRRATRVIGSAVYNEYNESIGEVDDLLLGTQPVAVISVGGFLGIGAKLIAVPYERLQLNAERNRWMLTGTGSREGLNALPTFSYDAIGPRS